MAAGRRFYGTGQLFERAGNWYGRFYVNGQRVKRKLGPVRPPGSRDGLTRAQAERELRRRIEAEAAAPRITARLTVEDAGDRLLKHLEAIGRKPGTVNVYRAALKTHITPVIGAMDLARVHPADVERVIAVARRAGTAPMTILNALGVLHGIFEFAIRRGWCRENPCKRVDKPRAEPDTDIRFLDRDEIEALLRATPRVQDRVLFLTAAMTGLRQGELLALRWRDVDWAAGRLRVRRNYVRGEWGTPKTRRGSRSVPLADRVAGELDRHFRRSAYQADDDLVFGHPQRGTVLDHSDLVKRFKAAVKAAGVREVRFHDLRHSFGTQVAAAGVPMRTLQEWLGHVDYKTTLIYADYAPSAQERELVERAFGRGPNSGPNLSETERNGAHANPLGDGDRTGAPSDEHS